MRALIKRKDVTDLARRLGFTVSVSAPGDGLLRYHLRKLTRTGFMEYTGCGSREAWSFLVGYEAGNDE